MTTTALRGAHLSLQQDRLWSFQQGSRAYRSQCTILLKGTLNHQAFQQALQWLVDRHTLFRTVFYALPGMDVPIQVLGHRIEFTCPIISLEKIKEPQRLLDELYMQLQEKSFDLARGPLFRAVLFRLSAEEPLGQAHRLHISLPALYADAATLPLLLTELVQRYNAGLADQELDIEPLQYTAVSAWQKQLLLQEDEEAKMAREFWKTFTLSQVTQVQQKLLQAGILEKLKNTQSTELPVFEPLTLPVMLNEALSMRIYALASRSEFSVTAIFLACWLIVLWRFTGEEQWCLGVACDGRNDEALVEVLGLATRFVPFRGYIQDDWTFEQVVTFVERLLQITKQHQTYFCWPAVSDADNRAINPPFFPVTFEHEIWPASFPASQVNLSLKQRFCCTEPFLLKLSILQIGADLQLELSYDPQCVMTTCVPRLASLLHVLLQSAVERPQTQVGALTLLTADERKHLLTRGCAPVRSLPYRGLHQLFEEQVELQPNQLAVICSDAACPALTYQELNERANQLAQVLRKRGVGPNILVGLCLARSAQMLVGLLGVLKAGGAYLPLDAGSPPARLTHQLQESRTALLLTQQEMSTRLPTWEGQTLCLEDLEHEMSQSEASNLADESSAEDLAYVIYTSGSTGIPKGVMIRQSSVVNYTLALCESLQAEPGWQYATVSTLAADLGNTAIFCALASGGCLQVLDYDTVTSVEAMTKWVKQHPIDVLKIVPSHLSALIAGEQASDLLPRQALVLGGETLSTNLLEHLSELGKSREGGPQVYNHYGPTETTIGVLVHPLGQYRSNRVRSCCDENEWPGVVGIGGAWDGGWWSSTDPSSGATIPLFEQVPLGRPITNTQVYILDRRMQPVPVGVTGEVYIGGAGLGIGYIQQPEQTAEHFVPHPFIGEASGVGAHSGARLYRTGDLARYGENGQIEFLGRSDHQVKLRGYRIELAEIEAVLRQHPQVRDSAVILQEDLAQLVGYVVPRKQPVSVDMHLGDFLCKHLPEYMVPPTFIYLKFLPLTANGKVNRDSLTRRDSALRLSDRLPAHPSENHTLVPLIELDNQARTVVQPRDTTEWHLLQIWEEILQRQPLSVLDNFFQLGGHSLLAVRLMSHIAKRFERDLPLTTLFQHPTVATLASVLRQDLAFEERTPLVAIHTQGTRPPLFCVHPAGGTAFCYVNLARRLGPDQPFYGLHAPDLSGRENKWGTVEAIAAHYLAALQTVQSQGPYLLGGWSAGGIIAFEMAQQLQRQGQEVGLLALLDTSPPSVQMREKALEENVDLGDGGVAKELIHHFKITTPDDFDQREPEEQLVYALAQTKKIHAMPEDTSIELARRSVRTIMLVKHIVHLYVAKAYPHHIDYLAGTQRDPIPDASLEQTASSDKGEERADRRLQRWRELATGGMDVHLVPGDHQTLVEEPHVQGLAQALRQCIDRVCERLVRDSVVEAD